MGCLRGLVSIIAIVFVVAVIGAVVGGRKADPPANVPRGALPSATVPAFSAPKPQRTYADRLAETETTLAAFDFTGEVETADDIAASLAMLDVFATAANEVPSDEADKASRAKFIKKLGAVQAKVLPILRDKYGPAMRKELWEADGKARTIGTGFRTVEFIAAPFAANRNIKSTHETVYPSLMKALGSRRSSKQKFRDFSRFPLYIGKFPD